MSKEYPITFLGLLFLLVLAITGIMVYNHFEHFESGISESEVKLQLGIVNCAIYALGYTDALEKKEPLIGAFMSEESQKILKENHQGKDNLEDLFFRFYLLVYKQGFEDASNGRPDQSEGLMREVVKEHFDRETEIRAKVKETFEKQKKEAEIVRITRNLPRFRA